MSYKKGVHSSSGGSHRAKLYALMLMLAFGGALLGTMMLHKLKEKRVNNLVVKDKDSELLSLQLLLQKEKYRSKEIEKKNDEMKAKIYGLEGQKMELDRKVLEMKSTMNSLKDEQKVMESALEGKQNEIRMLQGQGNNEEVTAPRQNLVQKEAKIKELKQHLGISINDPTIFPENLIENETMAAQDKNKETDEHSRESTMYGNVTVTNEDVNKTELNKFEDGKVTYEIQDVKGNSGRLIETYIHGQMQENWQVEGTNGGDNNAGQAKGKMFHEDNDDSFKKSLSNFEDDNME